MWLLSGVESQKDSTTKPLYLEVKINSSINRDIKAQFEFSLTICFIGWWVKPSKVKMKILCLWMLSRVSAKKPPNLSYISSFSKFRGIPQTMSNLSSFSSNFWWCCLFQFLVVFCVSLISSVLSNVWFPLYKLNIKKISIASVATHAM